MHIIREATIILSAEEDGGVLHFKAVAVTEGEHNGIFIPAEEIELGAESFKDKEILASHSSDNVKDIVGKITATKYEEGKLLIDAVVFDNYAAKLIREGVINSVSIGAFADLEKKDGKIIARNLRGDHVALVRHPADPNAKIIVTYSAEEEELVKGEPEVENAKWDTKYINALPDAAFAVIEPCYKKGETKNKNARHLPHHTAEVRNPNENSTVDIPHLRNALARVEQIKPICEDSDREALVKAAKAHLLKHAKALLKSYKAEEIEKDEDLRFIKEYVEKEEIDMTEEIEKIRAEYEAQINELKERLTALSEELERYREKELAEFREKVKGYMIKAGMDVPENFAELSKDELEALKVEALEKIVEMSEKKVEKVKIKNKENNAQLDWTIIFKGI